MLVEKRKKKRSRNSVESVESQNSVRFTFIYSRVRFLAPDVLTRRQRESRRDSRGIPAVKARNASTRDHRNNGEFFRELTKVILVPQSLLITEIID